MTTKRDLPMDLPTDLSTVARSAKVDRLDVAIDQVTARMVQVRDDENLALRIARALPERSSRFGWLLPQCAAIAAVAIAAGMWTLRDAAPPSRLPSSNVTAVMALPNPVSPVEPGTAFRTKPVELLEPLEPLEPMDGGADHERSLAPIEAMRAIVMSDVEPGELPASPALVLAPIEIADLKMTAETFTQKEE